MAEHPDNVKRAMQHLNQSMERTARHIAIPFDAFLREAQTSPERVVRNVFQIFHDLVHEYVGSGIDEYPDDPESIHYVKYDCSRLFIKGADHPFFADRLFANRLVNLAGAIMQGAQQNKIYIFHGPPGCGKSTFLNNLLTKFEEFANSDAGMRYEIIWRFDRKQLGNLSDPMHVSFLERLTQFLEGAPSEQHRLLAEEAAMRPRDEVVEIPCPSHDHPLFIIPKDHRRSFFNDLFDDNFKKRLFTGKEFEWVFQSNACTFCTSLYNALLGKFKNPQKIYDLIYARPYQFSRRLGEGISVYNPGDRPLSNTVMSNLMFQRWINALLRDSNLVRYIYSQYAKTNNGVYALMDIKSQNVDRLIELHNIISEGVHKVEDIEENVNSLLVAVMNPEDKKNVRDLPSFSDRIDYIKIPYVMDLNTEVEIYRNVFGRQIDDGFLPRVLHNFARVIIASRLNKESRACLEWIGDPKKYGLYCDENLQLLKMEIYTGYIPAWLGEDDIKRLNAERRRRIIDESEMEGDHGISGRDSIKIFGSFYSSYAKEERLITMSMLINYFTKQRSDLSQTLPKGFLESLLRLYNYTILQEVKESLFYYNEKEIARDIQNYLFAINFEAGTVERCTYTGDRIEISDSFFERLEKRILGERVQEAARRAFRESTQREYASRTLTQEIMVEGKQVGKTGVYQSLHDRYAYNLKGKALDPFLENVNFRRAIKDYGEKDFAAYDKKIKNDVRYLIRNLQRKYDYTEKGAKEVCMYVIDNDLARTFAAGTEGGSS